MNVIKHAFRTLGKTPFLTGIAVFSLALGIGANAAIFSIFDQMLLKSLPVHEPDRLVNLAAPGPKYGSTSCGSAGDCDAVFSYQMFRDLQAAETGLAGIAAHVLFGANIASAETTTSGEGLYVSGSYFPLLGVQPSMGRLLGPPDDERAGEHFIAVLSYDFWERQLGLDPAALNSTVTVNGQPLTVVGVAEPGFSGTTAGAHPDVFVPVSMREVVTPGWEGLENRHSYWAYLFGRLPEGGTIEQASLTMNAVYSGIINEVEAPLQEGMSDAGMERFRAKQILMDEGFRGQSSVYQDAGGPIGFLLAVTALVLAIACANVANLLLARGASRAQEMAIRGSMGASRGQLLRQLMTESVVLATMGGLLSLVVARWTLMGILRAVPVDEIGDISSSISPTVLGFTAAVALGTGLLFGLYPALHASRQDLVSMLKAGGGQPASNRGAARFRSGLVTVQIAFSMALLVSAGLFIKSLVNVTNVDLGLDTQNVVTFGLSPELNGYETERSGLFLQQVEETLAALPGVTDVSSALVPLLSGNSWGTSVSVEGFESGPDIDSGSRLNAVGPGYFSTMGMPLLAGREFTDSDVDGAPKVAIVNEAFTRKFGLNGREAVGKFMSSGGSESDELDMQIVGLVQDASYNEVKSPAPPLYFTPVRQETWIGSLTFYVKTGLEPTQIMGGLPRTIAELDPNLPVENMKTLEAQMNEDIFEDRLFSTLAAAFATLATVLAAIGLYGVLAYTVAQRTREIGVRMALGAQKSNVQGMIIKQVTRMTLLGGIVGVVGAFGLAQLAESMLYGMEGADPFVVASVSLVLAAVAFGAAYFPARRASKVDPIHALKYE